MPNRQYIMGIDVGTTGLKTAVFTPDGKRQCSAYREYTLRQPGSGLAEIDPEVWWRSFCSCVEELGDRISMSSIAGIGVSCANALVMLDSGERPVRPAIMQLDKRAHSLTNQIREELGDGYVFRTTGNGVAAGLFWGPTLRWVALNEPDRFCACRYFLNPASYLIMKLTGEYVSDYTRATTTMLYSLEKRAWDKRLCTYFGVEGERLPRLMASDQIAGYTRGRNAINEMRGVSGGAAGANAGAKFRANAGADSGAGPGSRAAAQDAGAAHCGLPAGIPVTAGIMDTVSAVCGLGKKALDGTLIMGSVGRFCFASEKTDRRFLTTVSRDGKQTVLMTPINNCGVSFRWIKDMLFPRQEGCGAASAEKPYDRMNRLAAEVPAGAGGLLFTPYLTGESCPYWDPQARGSFIGLSLSHSRGHLIRAVMEGVGFALNANLEILRQELGISAERILLGGGGAKSPLWAQILSDIFQTEVVVPGETDTETKGAALTAALACGLIEDESEMTGDGGEGWSFLPSQDREAYAKLFPIYKQIYSHTRDLSRQLCEAGPQR